MRFVIYYRLYWLGPRAWQNRSAIVADQRRFLRRKAAAKYLLEKFGFGAEATLAKAAVTGEGPLYQKAGRIVLYTPEALEEWALGKIGAPRRSSSEPEISRTESLNAINDVAQTAGGVGQNTSTASAAKLPTRSPDRATATLGDEGRPSFSIGRTSRRQLQRLEGTDRFSQSRAERHYLLHPAKSEIEN